MFGAQRSFGTPGTQKGVTLTGLLMWAFVLVFVSIFGFKLLPAYIEFLTVKKTIVALSQDSSLKGASITDIRKAFDRRASIDNISVIKGADLEIARDGNTVTIGAAYPVRIRMAGNVSACIDFATSSSGEE